MSVKTRTIPLVNSESHTKLFSGYDSMENTEFLNGYFYSPEQVIDNKVRSEMECEKANQRGKPLSLR